jgi:hypothetical protein
MSLLLGQESGEETSGAAPGEEYTKGSSHLVWASVIAVLVVSAAIAAFMLLGEKPPVAAGEIVQVWACPQDVETSGFDASGASMGKESFDRVLLFAHVRLRNRSGNPLLLEDILANLKLADGTLSVSAGSPAQYEEIFVAYPKLAALHGNVLAPRTVIAPGQSLDGTVFWAIRRSKLEWEGRQGLDFTFTFQYQPSLRLTSRAAVTVLPQ